MAIGSELKGLLLAFGLASAWKQPAEPERSVSDFHNELPELGTVLRKLESASPLDPFNKGGGRI